jgi:hypothetical protein
VRRGSLRSMTIHITQWRRAAAAIAVVASLVWAAEAHARSEQRFPDGVRVTLSPTPLDAALCGIHQICVFANANYQGVQASFPRCTGNRPKSYELRKYGLPPVRTGWLTGVTSWRNNLGSGYSAQFLDMQGLPLIRVNRPGGGHMPAGANDKAAWVDLLCLP